SERIVSVNVQPRSYPVVIGAGVLNSLGARVREASKAHRVAVLTDEHVGPLYADQAMGALRNTGLEPALITVPAGEASKSLETLGRVFDALAAAKIDRTSVLVAL